MSPTERQLLEGLDGVQGDFQIPDAIAFGFRKLSAADIDLHRRQDEARHVQGSVAGFPQGDEIRLGGVILQVNIAPTLIANGGLPSIVCSAGRLVVVAEEDPCCVRQGQQALDGRIKGGCVATGKVTSRGPVVGHEERVADKYGIADDMGQTGWRMARNMEGDAGQTAD